MSEQRVGIGYDCHRLTEGRRLVLGGVEIPHDRGLTGHSDADILTHAIIDALLGAAGMGDIGGHFPDSDERWSDASSLELVAQVKEMLQERGWSVVNLDATLVMEAPRISIYIEEMRELLGERLDIEPARVSIKATTSEGMGFVGRGEGAAAFATVMIGREG